MKNKNKTLISLTKKWNLFTTYEVFQPQMETALEGWNKGKEKTAYIEIEKALTGIAGKEWEMCSYRFSFQRTETYRIISPCGYAQSNVMVQNCK